MTAAKKLPNGPLGSPVHEQVNPFSLTHPLFKTAYGPRHRVVQDPGGPSMTKQSFKDECDVNVIMRRYEMTGLLPESRQDAQYGDVTGLDYQEAMLLVADARSKFESLPARVRARFDNDPGAFLAYMEDPDPAELKELGLLNPEAIARLDQEAAEASKGSPGEPPVPAAAPAAPAAAAAAAPTPPKQ